MSSFDLNRSPVYVTGVAETPLGEVWDQTELSMCAELSSWWLASTLPPISPPWVLTVVASPPWVSVVVVCVGAMTTLPPEPAVALPPAPPPPERIPPPEPPWPPAALPPLASMLPVLTTGPSLPEMTSPPPLLWMAVLPWLSEERCLELARECLELYCWDRLGAEN